MTSRRQVFAALPAGALALASQAVAQPKKTQSVTATVNGLLSGGSFTGAMTVTGFQIINGVLNATVSLVGTLRDGAGAVIGTVSQIVMIPLQVAGTCEILTLTLGPLDLNLLGLMVHLNQVVLIITAVPGAGNLLGNLLCAIANLLNQGGPLDALLQNLLGLLQKVLAAL